MSIFDSIKHGFEKAGHAIEHAAEDAGDKIKDAGEKVVHEIEHDADKVKDLAMSVFDDLKHDLEKIGNGIKEDFEKLGNEIKKSLDEEFGKARDAVDQIPKDVAQEAVRAKAALEGVQDEIKKDFAIAGKKTEDGIAAFGQKIIDAAEAAEKKIEADIKAAAKGQIATLTAKAIHEGLAEADKAIKAFKKGIDKLEAKAPTIVDMINGLSLPINLGPVQLKYANGLSRAQEIADALDKVLAGDFKLTQTFLDDLLRGLGPDTITIKADVEFFVEIGIDLEDLPFAAFIEIADIVFDAIGIPE